VKQAWSEYTNFGTSNINPDYKEDIQARLDVFSANARERNFELLSDLQPVETPAAGDIIYLGGSKDFVLVLGVSGKNAYYCELNRDDQGNLTLGDEGERPVDYFTDRPGIGRSYVVPILIPQEVSDASGELQPAQMELEAAQKEVAELEAKQKEMAEKKTEAEARKVSLEVTREELSSKSAEDIKKAATGIKVLTDDLKKSILSKAEDQVISKKMEDLGIALITNRLSIVKGPKIEDGVKEGSFVMLPNDSKVFITEVDENNIYYRLISEKPILGQISRSEIEERGIYQLSITSQELKNIDADLDAIEGTIFKLTGEGLEVQEKLTSARAKLAEQTTEAKPLLADAAEDSSITAVTKTQVPKIYAALDELKKEVEDGFKVPANNLFPSKLADNHKLLQQKLNDLVTLMVDEGMENIKGTQINAEGLEQGMLVAIDNALVLIMGFDSGREFVYYYTLTDEKRKIELKESKKANLKDLVEQDVYSVVIVENPIVSAKKGAEKFKQEIIGKTPKIDGIAQDLGLQLQINQSI
ncbi:MAG: hypothetical protein KAJ14_14925, partial [Candidatus Omnitrophica bacterium]|nr:hypothetical protein [Candidatus Omnitrophota bacterium]